MTHHKPPGSSLPPVAVTYEPRAEAWRLMSTYEYHDGDATLLVLEGFWFDLSSVPRALWWGIGPHELGLASALLHDALYRHGGLNSGRLLIQPARRYSRKEADKLFARVMKQEGVSWWRRKAAYYAVRAFGGGSWQDPAENPFLSNQGE